MLGWLLGTAIVLGPAAAPPEGPVAGSADPAAPRAHASTPAPALSEVALDYHRRRTTLGLAGMGTLTGWATVNIAAGIAGNLTTTGPARFFHQGNWMWNTVNLGLGVWGLVSQRRDRARPVPLAQGRARAREAQRVFGINAGLDVLYLAAGTITWTLGRDLGHARVHGYGQALVLQGAFLFAFDVAMMLGHELSMPRPDPDARLRRARPRSCFSGLSGTRMVHCAASRLRLAPAVVAGPQGDLAPGLVLRLR